VFFPKNWENCKSLAAVDEVLALKGSIDPLNDINPENPSFKVSSIQDLNKLVRAAAKKAAEFPTEISTDPKLRTEGSPLAEFPGEISTEVPVKTEAASSYREIHIRLAASAADELALYSLRNCLERNSGACPVYIHVPASEGSGETVIRSDGKIDNGAFAALEKCDAVVKVWGV